MVIVRGVHVVGPLEPYAEGLACELARLGFTELSAGGQARMGLQAGEVTVRGKGNRHDRLPLTADAGEATAAWLQRGRPATALDRSVFTRIKAPHRGLTSGGVTQAVAAAARRAGLGAVHAHRLRHSAATAPYQFRGRHPRDTG